MAGTYIDPRRSERPFADVLDAWRETWDGRLSPTTVRRYDSIVRTYLIPEFGRQKIGAVTHEAVQRYVTRLAANPASRREPSATCTRYCEPPAPKAVRMGMMKLNPCTAVDLPRARREEMLFLTADEVRRWPRRLTRSTAH